MYSRENKPPLTEISGLETADKNEDKGIEAEQDKILKAAREKFTKTGDRETVLYKRDSFNIYQRLAEVSGPLIEVGGPSDEEYDLVDFSKVDKKLHISNISRSLPEFYPSGGKFLGYEKLAGFQADARNLPLRPESVGAIFIKALGDDTIATEETRSWNEIEADQQKLRRDAVIEAFKALQPRGLLVFETTDLKVLDYAKSSGFEIIENRVQYAEGNDAVGFNFIFEKPVSTID